LGKSLNCQSWPHHMEVRQHCRLSICSYFCWLWQILRIWDEQACLMEVWYFWIYFEMWEQFLTYHAVLWWQVRCKKMQLEFLQKSQVVDRIIRVDTGALSIICGSISPWGRWYWCDKSLTNWYLSWARTVNEKIVLKHQMT